MVRECMCLKFATPPTLEECHELQSTTMLPLRALAIPRKPVSLLTLITLILRRFKAHSYGSSGLIPNCRGVLINLYT